MSPLSIVDDARRADVAAAAVSVEGREVGRLVLL